MADDAKRYYPAFLDLTDRLVVLVGEGRSIDRKAKQLHRYGAQVTVVTPNPSDELVEAEGEGHVVIETRDYVRGDLAGAALVICTSADIETRKAVAAEARSVGCPANIAESPELSSFLIPGVVHREPLQIAVSTGGFSPHVAKRIRRAIADEFGEEWGKLVPLAATLRALALAKLEDAAAADALVDAAIDADIAGRLKRGDEVTAEGLLAEFAPADED